MEKTHLPQMSATKWAGVIVLIGAVLVSVGSIFDFWDNYGWVGGGVYAADKTNHDELHKQLPTQETMKGILDSLVGIKKGQDENFARFECIELDKNMPALRVRVMASAPGTRVRVDLEQDYKKLEAKWNDNHCSTFD